MWEQAPGKWDWSPGRCALADSKAAAKDATERWLAEHVAAPLRPLLALLPVPEGHVRVRAAVATGSVARGESEWAVHGYEGASDVGAMSIALGCVDGDDYQRAGFIVADVKIPRVADVVGEVAS